MSKTPRQFRNQLYEHMLSHGVSSDAVTMIITEAELYANAYEAFKLRDIEHAAKVLGFEPVLSDKKKEKI